MITTELNSEFYVKPIGVIRSCFPDKFGVPRQPGLVKSNQGEILIHPEFQPQYSLQGLQNYSHLWVIFKFHKNPPSRFRAKVHPPRLEGESIGVFASRSPHRPNGIGLSVVEIVSVLPSGVVIRGGDFVDGTPVLDLKPYLPKIESLPKAMAMDLSSADQELQVEWGSKQLELLDIWSKKGGGERLKELIEETLALDPRPRVYRGYEGGESKYRQSHAVRILNGDVHFTFKSTNTIEILDILLD